VRSCLPRTQTPRGCPPLAPNHCCRRTPSPSFRIPIVASFRVFDTTVSFTFLFCVYTKHNRMSRLNKDRLLKVALVVAAKKLTTAKTGDLPATVRREKACRT
jgi:hypothetical protein